MCREQRYYIFIARSQISFLQEFSSAIKFSPYFTSITSVDSLDWKDYGVDSIIKTVTGHKHLGSGSIILCHNGAKFTSEALDKLIQNLKDQGYTFVPLSELIYRDHYHLDHEGRQIKD